MVIQHFLRRTLPDSSRFKSRGDGQCRVVTYRSKESRMAPLPRRSQRRATRRTKIKKREGNLK